MQIWAQESDYENTEVGLMKLVDALQSEVEVKQGRAVWKHNHRRLKSPEKGCQEKKNIKKDFELAKQKNKLRMNFSRKSELLFFYLGEYKTLP